MFRFLLVLVPFFIVAFFVFRALSEKISPQPKNLGVDDEGKLAPCPNKPNCVSSQASKQPDTFKHIIAPLQYETDKETAFSALKTVLSNMPNTTLETKREDYIYVTCRTPTMKFIDDVEFYFAAPNKIDVRSGSRLGYGDMGTNRKRIEAIRQEFTYLLK